MIEAAKIAVRVVAAYPGWPLVLAALALFAAGRWLTLPRAVAIWGLRASYAAFALFVAVIAAKAVGGTLYPNYGDDSLAINAITGWLWITGHPIYPDPVTGDLYGMGYGPLFYQLVGTSLGLLGPSILNSKLPFVLIFIAGIAAVVAILRQRGVRGWNAAMAAGFYVIVLGYYGDIGYWLRPDPVLIVIAVCGAWLAFNRSLSATMQAVLLGVLAGIAANFKIHGVVYAAPAGLILLLETETWTARAKIVLTAFAVSVVILLLPFALPNTSLPTYIYYLKIFSQHGTSFDLLAKNLTMLASMIVPLLVLHYLARDPDARLRNILLVTLLSGIVVAIVAAKPGSGPGHLVPFAPYAAIAFGVMLQRYRERRDDRVLLSACAVLALVFVVTFQPLSRAWHVWRFERTLLARFNAGLAQIEETKRRFPDATISVADGHDDAELAEMTSLRVFPVFAGHPLPVDRRAWIDLKLAGFSADHLIDDIRSCRIKVWLVAGDPPFTSRSLYDRNALYPPELIAAFHDRYRLDRRGDPFNVWVCKAG